jgi:hypothetical protein
MTKTRRAAIIKTIDATTAYDASTVRIHLDGTISARTDADKTSRPDTMRYLVGYVSEF